MIQHSHTHSHHRHSTTYSLLWVVALILGFALVEALGGWWSGSLALLSDAGHMTSDALALLMGAFAAWVSHRPPSYKHSYGLGRAEIVAAWLSSLLMLIIAITIIVEAISRLHQINTIKGGGVIGIASLGLIVNLLAAWLLAKGERTLNIRAALLHVMSDLLGTIAALVSGAVIYYTGWMPIDPILSIVIGGMILFSSLGLLRESLLILMEAVPGHINMKKVSTDMLNIEGVKDIHDLHIWTLSSGNIALSAHIYIHELNQWQTVLNALMTLLKARYDIEHVTLQPEPEIMDCQPCKEPSAELFEEIG